LAARHGTGVRVFASLHLFPPLSCLTCFSSSSVFLCPPLLRAQGRVRIRPRTGRTHRTHARIQHARGLPNARISRRNSRSRPSLTHERRTHARTHAQSCSRARKRESACMHKHARTPITARTPYACSQPPHARPAHGSRPSPGGLRMRGRPGIPAGPRCLPSASGAGPRPGLQLQASESARLCRSRPHFWRTHAASAPHARTLARMHARASRI
jgi:hypothetical protein